MVFSLVLKWKVAISWTFWGVFDAVVGPLGRDLEGAAVSKEILVHLVGGGALAEKKRGRTEPFQTKTFDCTMGFPGEDVAAQPQR